MDEQQKAAVCCQVGKTWSRCMLCVVICYSPNQINMPRYAHQEIALTESRMRGQAQKEQRAVVCCQVGKTWSRCMPCVVICYNPNQINMTRYAHQEIALTERRMRGKAQKEYRAVVCCQVGKTWSRSMLCVGICYSPYQINMPRCAHQEIALTERRMRGQAQKALHALTFLSSAFCSLPVHYRLICQLVQSACHWRRFLALSTVVWAEWLAVWRGTHSNSREMWKVATSHFLFWPEGIIVKGQLVFIRSKYSLMQETLY